MNYTEFKGATPVFLAAKAVIDPQHDIFAAVKILVDELHADVNTVNDRHGAALHGAVCRSADWVVQYLVDKGAKLDVRM